MKKLSAEEVDKLVEGNEFIEQYKSIPKKFRARLTRKQMLMMGKEFTMAETLNVTFQEDRKAKRRGVVLAGQEEETAVKKDSRQRLLGAAGDASGTAATRKEPVKPAPSNQLP